MRHWVTNVLEEWPLPLIGETLQRNRTRLTVCSGVCAPLFNEDSLENGSLGGSVVEGFENNPLLGSQQELRVPKWGVQGRCSLQKLFLEKVLQKLFNRLLPFLLLGQAQLFSQLLETLSAVISRHGSEDIL